jgi:hypothetical protein
MPIKMVKGKKVDVTFRKESVKKLFMNLTKKAEKVSVDWAKFREVDKHGIFEDFTNAQLSMKFRNFSLRESGMCWHCGKEEATEKNGTCKNCAPLIKAYNHNYNHGGRKAVKDAK